MPGHAFAKWCIQKTNLASGASTVNINYLQINTGNSKGHLAGRKPYIIIIKGRFHAHVLPNDSLLSSRDTCNLSALSFAFCIFPQKTLSHALGILTVPVGVTSKCHLLFLKVMTNLFVVQPK